MAKLRLTIITEYEANPDHYGTDDPVQMAAMDEANLIDDPVSALDMVDETAKITVEVISE